MGRGWHQITPFENRNWKIRGSWSTVRWVDWRRSPCQKEGRQEGRKGKPEWGRRSRRRDEWLTRQTHPDRHPTVKRKTYTLTNTDAMDQSVKIPTHANAHTLISSEIMRRPLKINGRNEVKINPVNPAVHPNQGSNETFRPQKGIKPQMTLVLLRAAGYFPTIKYQSKGNIKYEAVGGVSARNFNPH